MPLVNNKAPAPSVEVPNTVRAAAPEYKGVTVDTRHIPQSSLMTYLEGSSWTVNYYSQVLGVDSQPQPLNLELPPSLQQYKLIRGMQLKVTDPLTESQDTQGGNSISVQGGGFIYPPVIPNVGDMFLADVGDGREAVLQIKTAERKSMYKDSVHMVTWEVVDYSSETLRGNLNSKIVQTFVFLREFLLYGMNPLVLPDEFEINAQLAKRYHILLENYTSWFVSREYATLLVPGQTKPVYDPFLTRMFMSTFFQPSMLGSVKIRVLNCDDDPFVMDKHSIWDALCQRDRSMLRFAFKRAGLVSTRLFSNQPMLEGIRFSGIASVVYPQDPQSEIDIGGSYTPKTIDDDNLVPSESSFSNLSDLISSNDVGDVPAFTGDIIKPVLVSDYYVLSQAFYERTTQGQSLIELCLQKYFDDVPQNPAMLLSMARTVPSWGGLEKFYYTPLMLLLIRSHLRLVG